MDGEVARLYAFVGANDSEFDSKMSAAETRVDEFASGAPATAKLGLDTSAVETGASIAGDSLLSIRDKAELAAGEIKDKIGNAGDTIRLKLGGALEAGAGKVREFARAGSELAAIGRAIGGDFGQAAQGIGEFVRIAGDIGLVTHATVELGGAALGAVAKVAGMGTAAAVAVPEVAGFGAAAAIATPEVAALGGAADAAAAGGIAAIVGILGPFAIAAAGAVAQTQSMREVIDHMRDSARTGKDAFGDYQTSVLKVAAAGHTWDQALRGFDTDVTVLTGNLGLNKGVLEEVGPAFLLVADAARKASAEIVPLGSNVEAAANLAGAAVPMWDALATSIRNVAAAYGGTQAQHDQRMRQLGEAGAAGTNAGLASGDPSGVYTPGTLPDAVVTKIAVAHHAAAKAAIDHSQAIKDKLNAAYDDFARKAKRAMDDEHTARLQAIDDIRNEKNAEIDLAEAKIQSKVDAARSKVDDFRNARTERELRAAADDTTLSPQDKARAVQALGDFLDDQRLARLQSDANSAIASLEIDKKHNDDKATADKKAEDKRYRDKQDALDADLRLLKDHIDHTTKAWSTAFAEIAADAKKYGVDGILGIKASGTTANSKSATGKTFDPNTAALHATVPFRAFEGMAGGSDGGGATYVQVFLDSDEIAARVETRRANDMAARMPRRPSTGMVRG